jgi:hypothetical protein
METPTPTSTPATTCSASGVSLSVKNVELTLTNTGDMPIVITNINVIWSDTPEAQMLTEILFDGVSVVIANDPLPPSEYPAEKNWSGLQDDLKLNAFASKTLVLSFLEEVQGEYTVTVTFNNGCTTGGGS